MTTVLILTRLMLFVGFLDTSVSTAGQAERNGKYKVFSTFIWTMLTVLKEIGAPALTVRVTIVDILRMFFLSAVVSSRFSPHLFLKLRLASSRISLIYRNCSIYQIYDDKFKFIPPNPSE